MRKLSPVLAMYKCDNFGGGTDMAVRLIALGGFGHTSVLYVDEKEQDKIEAFGKAAKTSRVLVNMPASQGAIGDIYNFRLEPSLTLGCGSWGNNSVSENVGPKHLLNIKTVAARRENMLWFKLPPKVYFKYGCLPVALQELAGKKRAFIVTDSFLFGSGMIDKVTKPLEKLGYRNGSVPSGETRPHAGDDQHGVAIGGGIPSGRIHRGRWRFPDGCRKNPVAAV